MSNPCYSCIHFTSLNSICDLDYPCSSENDYKYHDYGYDEDDDEELITNINIYGAIE